MTRKLRLSVAYSLVSGGERARDRYVCVIRWEPEGAGEAEERQETGRQAERCAGPVREQRSLTGAA